MIVTEWFFVFVGFSSVPLSYPYLVPEPLTFFDWLPKTTRLYDGLSVVQVTVKEVAVFSATVIDVSSIFGAISYSSVSVSLRLPAVSFATVLSVTLLPSIIIGAT